MEEVLHHLIENGFTLQFHRPFQWRSGLKAPVYTDTRSLLSLPEAREELVSKFTEILERHFSDATHICGVATGGLPWAAMVAQKTQLPLIYVRPMAKSHGKRKAIEGILPSEARTVLIEDTVSTGGALLTAAHQLRKKEAAILGAMAVFSYAFSGVADKFRSRNYHFFPLIEFPQLIKAAREKGRLTDSEIEALRGWHTDPKRWKPGRILQF